MNSKSRGDFQGINYLHMVTNRFVGEIFVDSIVDHGRHTVLFLDWILNTYMKPQANIPLCGMMMAKCITLLKT